MFARLRGPKGRNGGAQTGLAAKCRQDSFTRILCVKELEYAWRWRQEGDDEGVHEDNETTRALTPVMAM